MEQHLKRILELIRKTGDTVIVVEKEEERAFVVMNIDKYENLLDGQTSFKPTHAAQAEAAPRKAIWDIMRGAGEGGETWDIDQLNKEELAGLEKQYREFAARQVAEAVEQSGVKQKEEEKPQNSQKRKDDEFGEEQFYLEPVE